MLLPSVPHRSGIQENTARCVKCAHEIGGHESDDTNFKTDRQSINVDYMMGGGLKESEQFILRRYKLPGKCIACKEILCTVAAPDCLICV